MMEKRGKIEIGVTPSEISGKPSIKIKDGQALAKRETPQENTVEKIAALVDT